ncbi:MAG: hypothetical protein LBQ01_04525 [Prevotellaceae bacterium]|jgi:hypothetical protein|nr:hypothetical protein [Prevotellaceae bacterium]
MKILPFSQNDPAFVIATAKNEAGSNPGKAKTLEWQNFFIPTGPTVVVTMGYRRRRCVVAKNLWPL